MRIILAIEISDGESYSAEAPFAESDLLKSPGKLADLFGLPMFKAVLEGFEEPKAETHKERMQQLDRATKRSVEFFRQRQRAQLNS